MFFFPHDKKGDHGNPSELQVRKETQDCWYVV
jgi:hypothetical protein